MTYSAYQTSPHKGQARFQRGNALLMTLFILIILMLLGTVLVRILATGSEAVATEVIGTRALSAANSAMQAELQRVFPLDNAAGVCNANANYVFANGGVQTNGLQHCRATTSCNVYAVNDGVNYYRLTSTGSCGTGAIDDVNSVLTSRTVRVEARDL